MRRIGGVAAGVAALWAVAGAAPAAAQTPYEAQVLAALNSARTDPAAFAKMLRTYRSYFRDKLVTMPGVSMDLMTNEGVAVVDETIAFLERQAPVGAVAPAGTLESSATDHTSDQGPNGAIGHDGSDGSSPSDRARRHGGGPYVAEVIAYGSFDPLDVVRQLIVDDGVSDRGHRTILYAPELRYAGVSCGKHKSYRTMCTIDLGLTADGRMPAATRMAAGEQPPAQKVAMGY